MYAKMICYPPLGQPTVVPVDQDSVDFIVLLETTAELASSKRRWQVSLWHDLEAKDDQWSSLEFEEGDNNTNSNLNIQALGDAQSQSKAFTVSLKGRPSNRSTVRFTIRYRASSDAPWKWAHNQFSNGDGVLHYQSQFIQHDLSFYIQGTSPDVTFEAIKAETPDTQLWSLAAPVKAAEGNTSGYSTHQLGIPQSYSRWFALVRLWSPWLAPRQGKAKFDSDKDAVLVSFLREDGLHIVILAISGIDDVLSLLKHDNEGSVLISGRNESEEKGTSRVLVAVAKTFEIANAAVMYQARRMVMAIRGESDPVVHAFKNSGIKPEWLEEWADGFAFCTWNSLGQSLTEDKIYAALDSFEKIDVKITNLIIDDCWQSCDRSGEEQYVRGMTRFEAHSQGFPSGLWHTIHEIRKNHPSIQHIAVWHAIMGYWGGISPQGQLAKDYKTVKAGGPDWTCIDPDDISRWYEDFYSFLSESGIDSVKTDAQFMLDDLQSAKDRRGMIREYQDSWSIAMLRAFSARAISCMSQTPQMIFHSQLPTNKPKVLVRNSDDFFPDVEASHPWHIFCNAHNALLTQHLNVLPDWDMFQTSHPWAGFHAAARCLSGGPIYITDSPGQHDVDLIRQMTARTPRGSTVILRPHRLGKTSQAYVGYEEEKLLKIETYVGAARTGSSIVGVFNVSKSTLSEILTLNDFPGTEEGEYIIRSHVAKSIGQPTTRSNRKSVIKMELGTKGYDILSATPLQRFHIKSGEITIASLGLLGKLSGAAAIVGIDIYTEKSGRLRVYTSFKALGKIGFYISDLEKRSIENDFMGQMFGKPVGLDCVKKSLDYENVLEIDTEKAWAESDQKANWSNEVHFELFIFQLSVAYGNREPIFELSVILNEWSADVIRYWENLRPSTLCVILWDAYKIGANFDGTRTDGKVYILDPKAEKVWGSKQADDRINCRLFQLCSLSSFRFQIQKNTMEKLDKVSQLGFETAILASTDILESAKEPLAKSTQRPIIQMASASASEDAVLVDTLVRIVNAVYAETEGDIFVDSYQRTNAEEVKGFLRAGEIGVAYLPSSSSATQTPIGCIRIQRLSPKLGDFGMMALDSQYRGGGFGRDMVHFAEHHCRELGLPTMQCELLFPSTYEHAFKLRLQSWYERMGYKIVRLGVFQDDYPQLAPLLRGPTEYRVFEKPMV